MFLLRNKKKSSLNYPQYPLIEQCLCYTESDLVMECTDETLESGDSSKKQADSAEVS